MEGEHTGRLEAEAVFAPSTKAMRPTWAAHIS